MTEENKLASPNEKIEFEGLEISDELKKAVCDMGFTTATMIQSRSIPVILSGKDVIGHSQTGTGKTAAFGIPAVEIIEGGGLSGKIQVLILCPTRELAQQSAAQMRLFAKYKPGVRILPVYGGQSIDLQIKALKAGVNIIIGTPGRIMDHMRRRTIRLDNLKMIILDEADEMLNMGFLPDIETILKEVPDNRQTLLFSATMSREIMAITGRYLTEPVLVNVVEKALTLPNIKQYMYDIPRGTKVEVLCRLIDYFNPKRSMIFCNTKKMVEELNDALRSRGYFAETLHGDMKQFARTATMDAFKKGRVDMLIATDVAARGLDIDHVEYVINFDLPQDMEFYIHRIGRTGRIGRQGTSLTLITGNKEFVAVKALEKHTKSTIELAPIPGLKEVEEARNARIVKDIENTIAQGLLVRHKNIVDALLQKGVAAEDIAAGVMKMLFSSDREFFDYEDSIKKEESRIWRSRQRPQRGKEGFGKGGLNKDGLVRAKSVKLMLNVGKRDRILPGNIVGAIANEAGLPGKAIRGVDIYDNYSFVEVPRDMADMVISAINGIHMKGKRVKIEKVRMEVVRSRK